MTIESETLGSVVVAKVRALTLETANVGAFRSAVEPVIETSDSVILDLSEVTFMDSTGLGAMLSCLRQINGKGGSLRVCCLKPEVQRLFDLVMMDRVFDVHPSLEAALATD